LLGCGHENFLAVSFEGGELLFAEGRFNSGELFQRKLFSERQRHIASLLGFGTQKDQSDQYDRTGDSRQRTVAEWSVLPMSEQHSQDVPDGIHASQFLLEQE